MKVKNRGKKLAQYSIDQIKKKVVSQNLQIKVNKRIDFASLV